MTTILHTELLRYLVVTSVVLLGVLSLFFIYNSVRASTCSTEMSGKERMVFDGISFLFIFLAVFSIIIGLIIPVYICRLANANAEQLKSEMKGKKFTGYSLGADEYKLFYSESEDSYVEIPDFVCVRVKGASEIDFGVKSGISVEIIDNESILTPITVEITDYSKRAVRILTD
jgi:hypothetical protein